MMAMEFNFKKTYKQREFVAQKMSCGLQFKLLWIFKELHLINILVLFETNNENNNNWIFNTNHIEIEKNALKSIADKKKLLFIWNGTKSTLSPYNRAAQPTAHDCLWKLLND